MCALNSFLIAWSRIKIKKYQKLPSKKKFLQVQKFLLKVCFSRGRRYCLLYENPIIRKRIPCILESFLLKIVLKRYSFRSRIVVPLYCKQNNVNIKMWNIKLVKKKERECGETKSKKRFTYSPPSSTTVQSLRDLDSYQ